MAKTETNDGTRGGNLKGKPHYDSNGNPVGGIKAVTDKGAPVEVEDGEVVINKKSSAKHWKLLSKINQDEGNGVPIGPPSEVSGSSSVKKRRGGKIEFNPNQLPPPHVIQYAVRLKEKFPHLWEQGDVRYGNAAAENLSIVSKRGHWLPSEQWMYDNWKEYTSKHKSGESLHDIVAMIQWGGIVSKGWPYMKSIVEAETGITLNSRQTMTKPKMMGRGGIVELTDQYKFNTEESQCIITLFNAVNDIKTVRDAFIDSFSTKSALIFIFREPVTKEDKEAFNSSLSRLTICDDYFNTKKGFGSTDSLTIFIELKNKVMEKGGHIGFEGLAAKVAANYQGKKVAKKYRKKYGAFYDAAEAKEVGDKVAGKVKATMEDGGTVQSELQMGIEHEKEHAMTAKKIWEHDIPLEEYARYTAIDHLKEDPKYYSKLKAAKLAKGGAVGNTDLIDRIPLDKIIGNEVKLTINGSYDNVYKITKAHITEENFTYRDLFISLDGKDFEYRVPSSKLQDFLDGMWIDIKDDQGDPYSIELINPVEIPVSRKNPKEANDIAVGEWLENKETGTKVKVWNVDPDKNQMQLEDRYGNQEKRFFKFDPKKWKLTSAPVNEDELVSKAFPEPESKPLSDEELYKLADDDREYENKAHLAFYSENEDKVPEDTNGEVFYTIAPENYDGFGTRTVEMTDYYDERGRQVRKVFVPEKNIEWQTNRYKSGLGAPFNEADFNEMVSYEHSPWKKKTAPTESGKPKIMTFEEFQKTLPDVENIFWGDKKENSDTIYKAKYDTYLSKTMYFKHGRKNGEKTSVKAAYDAYVGNIIRSNPKYQEAPQPAEQINTDVLSYKNPYEINRAIEKLVDLRGEHHYSYTPDEIKFIGYYSGYGGLEKQGTFSDDELKGLLYEYYTPDAIVKKMWALAYKYGYGGIGDNAVFEPSVGIGAFLKYAPEGVRMAANEINQYSAKICQILYPTADIILQPFEKNFIQQNKSIKHKTSDLQKFSLVIGNPPYGKLNSRYIGMGEGDFTMAGNFTEYFITRGLDLLVQDGLLIYIVGAEQHNGGTLFLDGGMSKVKQVIFDKAELVDAYRLPTKIFERTGVSSEILVFKKR